VRAVAVAELDGRPVVVSGPDDGRVRVTRSRHQRAKPFTRHSSAVTAVVVVVVAELDGRLVVVELDFAHQCGRDAWHTTVIAGTDLGLVALDLPPLTRSMPPAEATHAVGDVATSLAKLVGGY